MEVNCVIAGGMGTHAYQLFSERGVKVWLGVSGKVEDVIVDLNATRLASTTGPDNCVGSGDQTSVPCVRPD